MTGPDPETRRSDLAVPLDAAMSMGEQHLAIGVKKVGGPKFAQVSGEFRNDEPPLRQRRWRDGGVPQAVKALQQRTKRMFRIGRANRAVVLESQVRGARDAWQVSVMGKHVGSPAKLPYKGLCVRQAAPTARCMPDVRQGQRGVRPPRSKELDEWTVARRNRLPVQSHIVALVERHTPAVARGAGAAAVGSERLERQGKLRRAQARHSEKFTHPGHRRPGLSPRAAGATGLRRVRPGFRCVSAISRPRRLR